MSKFTDYFRSCHAKYYFSKLQLQKYYRYVLFLSMALPLHSLVSTPAVWAAAKRPSAPQFSSTPDPIRTVVLTPVGVKAFQLPNGQHADISLDIQTMLNTSVTNNSNFAPMDAAGVSHLDPCVPHLEIRSAVTNFQLDLVDLGVSIGFSPGGALASLTSVTGSAKVNVGTISMDFSIWNCTLNECISMAASTANQATYGGSLSFLANFSIIQAGPSLVVNTPLGSIIRKIMDKGISSLARSSSVNELPWEAHVREVDPVLGSLVFDEGYDSRILVNQNFEVYAPGDSLSQPNCGVYRTIAYVHTTSVDTVSSRAFIDQVLDPRGVKVGDIVMIRP